jgi:hypothetical protein
LLYYLRRIHLKSSSAERHHSHEYGIELQGTAYGVTCRSKRLRQTIDAGNTFQVTDIHVRNRFVTIITVLDNEFEEGGSDTCDSSREDEFQMVADCKRNRRRKESISIMVVK